MVSVDSKPFFFPSVFFLFFVFVFFVLPTNCSWRNRKSRQRLLIAGRQRFLKTLTHYNLFVVIRCIQPVYILSDIFDKQQKRWKLFLRAVPLRRDETSKEMRRSVGGVAVYFWKLQRFLSHHSAISNYKNSHVTISSTLKFSTVISSADLTDYSW